MSHQLAPHPGENPNQTHAIQAAPLTTALRPYEPRRSHTFLKPLISILILVFIASLILRGVEIRISDITISLGR